ncbi:hypothetical protein ATCC90586_011741 [Pythium insidiosum]|nr:hypothetical protein ATCC90586_011741 [Pythium insidiosum]
MASDISMSMHSDVPTNANTDENESTNTNATGMANTSTDARTSSSRFSSNNTGPTSVNPKRINIRSIDVEIQKPTQAQTETQMGDASTAMLDAKELAPSVDTVGDDQTVATKMEVDVDVDVEADIIMEADIKAETEPTTEPETEPTTEPETELKTEPKTESEMRTRTGDVLAESPVDAWHERRKPVTATAAAEPEPQSSLPAEDSDACNDACNIISVRPTPTTTTTTNEKIPCTSKLRRPRVFRHEHSRSSPRAVALRIVSRGECLKTPPITATVKTTPTRAELYTRGGHPGDRPCKYPPAPSPGRRR